jgi:putative transposase
VDLNQTYFFTASIKDWIPLLQADKFKQIILNSLTYLIDKGKIKVYGFVIMPNHIHLIWNSIELNGKEMPYASFMKFTGHQFLHELRKDNPEFLERFKWDEDDNRNYQFWQRNALPVRLYNREILEQKLTYIHYNPLQAHWTLVTDPNDYYYSSCSFYEHEDNKFCWLTHYHEDF